MGKYIFDNTLVGKHSAFNQELFNKYDIPARDKIKSVLADFVKDNPDIYQQDLVITDETYKYKYIELQVCVSWIGENFPYDNPYVYERKGRYDEDTLFITLNKSLTRGLIFDAKSFKNIKPKRLKKYSREFIYIIPWCQVMPIIIDTLTPDTIKLY